MFFFKRSVSLVESGLFRGFTDWHCHLLPGVDDGVRTLEETLRVLSLYETLGVKEVWLTPHVMEDVPNEVSDLKARFEELRTAYKGPVTLYLASENMLDNLFEERLERNELLRYRQSCRIPRQERDVEQGQAYDGVRRSGIHLRRQRAQNGQG